MGQFVRMKRFEKFKMDDFLKAMDVFEVEWIGVDRNKRHHRQQITRGRRYLAAILALLLNEFIIPVMKYNFYITEKHKEANKIFYFRKPIWSLVSKLAVCKFSEANLERIDQKRCAQLNRKSILNYPEGKLRLVPKKGTFRPILTFNRKLKVEANPNSKLRLSMNQLLIDTQLVLRNLKAILGRKGGYCVFDNSQMTPRYD